MQRQFPAVEALAVPAGHYQASSILITMLEIVHVTHVTKNLAHLDMLRQLLAAAQQEARVGPYPHLTAATPAMTNATDARLRHALDIPQLHAQPINPLRFATHVCGAMSKLINNIPVVLLTLNWDIIMHMIAEDFALMTQQREQNLYIKLMAHIKQSKSDLMDVCVSNTKTPFLINGVFL